MWPTDEFKQWDDESKVSLFANRCKTRDVKRDYARICAKIRFERRTNSNVSQMRPVEYWTKLGYDVPWLMTNTQICDQFHNVTCGWYFRLSVTQRNQEMEMERDMQDILNHMVRRKMGKSISALPSLSRGARGKVQNTNCGQEASMVDRN